jgi:D-3-phosphoglycerate dehydrogenase
MKVLICDKVSKDAIEKMRAAGLQVDDRAGIAADELKSIVGGYEVLVVRSATKVTAEVIEAGRNLKLIVRGGVGVDNIDVKAAEAKGVAVKNTPAASTESVAELAVGLMFALSRKIARADASMKAGQWEKKAFEGTEVAGKTLGVIGIGRIGLATARKAHLLGVKRVLAHDPWVPKAPADFVTLTDLDTLLKESDIITLHIPFDKIKGAVLGAREFGLMKPGVFLVNCARGGVVDETALLEALNAGKVAGAAVDVWAKEPTDNAALAKHPAVVALPHLGASTKEGQGRVGGEVADIIIEFARQAVPRRAN